MLFLSIMEFEKACMSSTGDAIKGNQKFIQGIVTSFPREAFDLLKTFYYKGNDVKRLRDSLLRGQKFLDAGFSVAKVGLTAVTDKESTSAMQVSRALSC